MIPKPRTLIYTGGQYLVPGNIRLHFPDTQSSETELFQSYLRAYVQDLLRHCNIAPESGDLLVTMRVDGNNDSNPEAYILDIANGTVGISSSALQGLRYGFQSLLQIVYLAVTQQSGMLPNCHIEDQPRFQWRGLHLDVSRHWFDASHIQQYLEWMEALKLNRFHWHLSDDQGWRLESARFPLLHEKGAWRTEPDGSTYGGYYSQETIRELVAYAASMGIEVVPEIDIPGHAQAILAAYPDLACFPQEFACLNVWGISEHILCAGKDEVVNFLKDLLSEIAELFPGPYVHLGGDEAPKTYWKQCPHCQQRIRSQGLSNEEELQSWLLKEMAAHLRALGKQVIGWDEILDGNIDSEPIVMVWRGDGKDAALNAERGGNRYILCPNRVLYFDWKQHPDAIGAHGVSTLANVYAFDPEGLTGNHSNLLLGAQANVWTEYMPDWETVRGMLYPRVYALAELLWTAQDQRDEPDFLSRLGELEGYL